VAWVGAAVPPKAVLAVSVVVATSDSQNSVTNNDTTGE